MSQEQDLKLTLGFAQEQKTINITIPPDEPAPWDLNSDLKVVNHRHPKVDALQKVTGRAKYTHDLNLPGMLYGGFVTSKHAHAAVTDLDLKKIEALPGVKAVLRLRLSGPEGNVVSFAGQPIAAIAATSRQELEEAIRATEARYEVFPHAATERLATRENAPEVNRGRPNLRRGEARGPDDFDTALEQAAVKVEATCTTQVQTHCCLETHGSVAQWNGDQLTLWTSTQATFGVLDQVARSLRLERNQIKVISEFMGGGFGSKFMAGIWSTIAAQFARDTGLPVKIMYDRRLDQIDGGNRPSSSQEMKLGVSQDGKLLAYSVDKLGTPGIGRGAGATNPMIYDFEKRKVGQGEIATHAGASQAFRAPGHPQGSFGLETIMNLAGEAIGKDLVEFRIQNDSHPIRKWQFARGAELIGWKENRKKTGSQTGRYREGYGVAGSRWSNFGGPRAEVRCVVHKDGVIEVRSGAQDIGVGTRTLMALIVAEELALGASMQRIKTFIGNTDDPIGPGSGGSQTAGSIAPAARQAAFLVGNELKALAAAHWSCEAKDLLFRDGKLQHIKDTQRSFSFDELCRLIPDGKLEATGKRRRNFSTYVSEVGGVQFAAVTVDTWTGVIKVDKIVALQDCGIIINKLTTEGQVLGGVIQGISYALHENRVMDRLRGHQLNADMEHYKITGPLDMPLVHVELVESAVGANSTSTAGVGEPTSIPTASAIAGAVHNAIGVPVRDLPMTPDRVLAALGGDR